MLKNVNLIQITEHGDIATLTMFSEKLDYSVEVVVFGGGYQKRGTIVG